MKKIIMFQGDIETQGYFSIQMKKQLEKLGHKVYLYDLKSPWKSSMEMLAFIEKGNTVVLSFNFHGMCGEPQFLDEEDGYIWDALNIPCYNILADHPYYYYKLLAGRPKNYCQLSIDKKHEKFMQRFFPEVKMGPFLPLGGTELKVAGAKKAKEPDAVETIETDKMSTQEETIDTHVPLKETAEKYTEKNIKNNTKNIADREIDVVFTGNYASPSRFEKYITRLGDEYTAFYYEMIEDLLAHPEQTVETVVEKYLRREIPQVTEAELKETMQNITFLDLYVRYYTRGKVVQTLVDAGIKVCVFGDKWNELECEHKENLIDGDSLFSEECLEKISNSRISLNVLPWFKEGAHDRIFNTMLNGAVCLTDTNIYLDTMLVDGKNCVTYSLTELDALPGKVKALLDNPKQMQTIADEAYSFARSHTWAERMNMFSRWLETKN